MIDPVVIGVLSIIAMLLLLGLGMSVGVSMLLVGFLSYIFISGWQPAIGMMASIPFTSLAHETYTVVPMFILMGAIAFRSGLGESLYLSARNWVGHLPGGLAIATVMGCAGFGAVCGSSVACAATMAKIAVPEMDRYGYSRSLSTGSIAAAGPLAAMIPPSILMVVYGALTDTSVAKLLIAGVLPGIVTAIVYSLTIYWLVRRNPQIAPIAPRVNWPQRFVSLTHNWGVLLIFLFIIGGIYSGVCTPTEAGAFGAAVAILVAIVNKKFNLRLIKDSFLDTAKVTAMLFLIFVGAMFFSYQFGVSRIPFVFADWLVGLNLSRMLVLVLIMAMYFVLGCLMDTFPMLVLTMPVVFPIVVGFKFDPVWFGILIVQICEIGMFTPPFGITLFTVQGSVPNIDNTALLKGIVPFVFAGLVALALLIIFPSIALFLPSMMN